MTNLTISKTLLKYKVPGSKFPETTCEFNKIMTAEDLIERFFPEDKHLALEDLYKGGTLESVFENHGLIITELKYG